MIRRTFNYSKFLIATLLLSANNIFAQSRSLKNVENTVIIGRVAYLSIGTFLVVRLIFILTSSDRGEDKVMKIGGLAVVLILGAIVVMMAEGVFS